MKKTWNLRGFYILVQNTRDSRNIVRKFLCIVSSQLIVITLESVDGFERVEAEKWAKHSLTVSCKLWEWVEGIEWDEQYAIKRYNL